MARAAIDSAAHRAAWDKARRLQELLSPAQSSLLQRCLQLLALQAQQKAAFPAQVSIAACLRSQ